MISKINVTPIIMAHFEVFRDRNTKKYSLPDLLGFYGVPFVVAAVLTYFEYTLSSNTINIVMISQTIFVPLLINVLVIVYGLIDGIKRRQIEAEANDNPSGRAIIARGKKRLEVLRQLYGSISYTILISGLSLCTVALYASGLPKWPLVLDLGVVYFLLTHLILTALMIVKRFYLLMASEFDGDMQTISMRDARNP